MIISASQTKKACDRGDDSTSKGHSVNPIWLYNGTSRACFIDLHIWHPSFTEHRSNIANSMAGMPSKDMAFTVPRLSKAVQPMVPCNMTFGKKSIQYP
jgi:hypothetical protein